MSLNFKSLMSFFKSIKLKGNGNITYQNEGDVININLKNFEELLRLLQQKTVETSDFDKLLYQAVNKETYSNDFDILVRQFTLVKNLNTSFEYSGFLKDFDLISLLRLRKEFYKEYYFERDYDIEFRQGVKSSNVLIIGNSLSGKTRIVFNYLKSISSESNSSLLFIPQYKKYKKYEIKDLENISMNKIAVLDEIDKYYNYEGANDLIEDLIKSGFRIIATCKTGPEYETYDTLSSIEIKDLFQTLYIKRGGFSDEQIFEITQNLDKDLNETEFDGNIGSLLLPISEMRKRFKSLLKSGKEQDKIAIAYLKSLKILNYASNFESIGLYSESKLKDLCLRYYIGKHASETGKSLSQLQQSLQKVKKKLDEEKIEEFYRNEENSIKILESDEFNLNFISKINEHIGIEEVYLNKIIEYSPFQAFQDINKLYLIEEQNRLGFYKRPYHYNNGISKADSYQKANSLYERMISAKVKPNFKTYEILIEKGRSENQKTKWIEKAKNEGLLSLKMFGLYLELNLNKDQIIKECKYFLSHINTCHDYTNDIIRWVFHKLMRKNKSIVMAVLELYSKQGIKLDNSIYNHVIKKAESFEQAKGIINLANENGVALSEVFYNNLTERSESFEQAKGIINLANENNVKLSEEFYNNLTERSESFEQAKGIINLANENNVKLSEEFYNSLTFRSESFEQAKGIINLANENNVKLSEEFYNNLTERSESFEQAKGIINLANENNVKLSEVFYNNLTERSESFEQAKGIINLANENNVKLSEEFYNSLTDRSESFEQAKGIINLANENNVKLSEEFYNSLTDRSESFEQAKGIINLANENNVKLSEEFYNSLTFRSESFEQAKGIINLANENNVKLSEVFVKTLIRNTPLDYTEINNFLIVCTKFDLKINDFHLLMLTMKINNWEQTKQFVIDHNLADRFKNLRIINSNTTEISDYYVDKILIEYENEMIQIRKIILNFYLTYFFEENMANSDSNNFIKLNFVKNPFFFHLKIKNKLQHLIE